jgi:hypothetical protein
VIVAAGCAHSIPSSSGTFPASSEAYRLVLMTTACWLGGVWTEAEGEPADARKATTAARCHEVVRWVFGSDDRVRYEQLRAFEEGTVREVGVQVKRLARKEMDDDGRRDLVALFDAVADAERVEVLVRSDSPKAVSEIQDRAPKQQTASSSIDKGRVEHTGQGTGAGALGFCPGIALESNLQVESTSHGVRMIVRVVPPARVEDLSGITEERAAALKKQP